MRDFLNRFRELNRNMPPAARYIYGALIFILLFAVLRRVIYKPQIMLMIIALYVGIVFHEVAHGVAANYMGDPTARLAGRLTLNPAKHIDPLGLLLPLFLIFTGSPFVIGWAKPVPVNFYMLRDKKWGVILVAIAGVITNFLWVIGAGLLLRFFPKEIVLGSINSLISGLTVNINNISVGIVVLLVYIILINLILGIFNLIPIPPLDGSRIIRVLFGQSIERFLDSMEKFGFMIIIVLLYLGILGKVILPIYSLIFNFVLKYIVGI